MGKTHQGKGHSWSREWHLQRPKCYKGVGESQNLKKGTVHGSYRVRCESGRKWDRGSGQEQNFLHRCYILMEQWWETTAGGFKQGNGSFLGWQTLKSGLLSKPIFKPRWVPRDHHHHHMAHSYVSKSTLTNHTGLFHSHFSL